MEIEMPKPVVLARYAKADQSFPFIRTHQYIEVIAIP